MDTQMAADIKELIKHIIKKPNIKHPANHFAIGNHTSEYGDTRIRPKAKEHKLWTPFKNPRYRCFLMIQLLDKTLRIHHVLDETEKWLRNKGYANLDFSQPQTFASERGSKDQFKKAIEINLNGINNEVACIEKIKQLIIDITNETINRGLNLRKTKPAKERR